MKKSMRILATVMIMAVLCAPGALAALERGDRGERVQYLQELLLDNGWLMDAPDGVFGKKTRQAVMDFQAWFDLPVDGAADDALIGMLEESLCGAAERSPRPLTEIEEADGAIRLNGTAIIEGDMIYYAGAIDGKNEGVYAMNADGTGLRRLLDARATLMAASGGNLLLLLHDWEKDAFGMELLRPDGTRVPVLDSSNDQVIAREGVFFSGAHIISRNGSMVKQLIPSEPEHYNCFWPMEVKNGWLYYLDSRETDETAYSEGAILPAGASLNRIQLSGGRIETLSGPGTRLVGVDDNAAYYVRRNYLVFTPDYDLEEVAVDEGLFRRNLATGEETRLADILYGGDHYVDYHTLCDGVIYGDGRAYALEERPDYIVRIGTDGAKLPNVRLACHFAAGVLGVADGWHFSCEAEATEESDGSYSTQEYILATDIESAKELRIALAPRETLFYMERLPGIAVANGRIYYFAYDGELDAECFRYISLDGQGAGTLVQGCNTIY